MEAARPISSGIPTAPLILGLAGLVPFWGLALTLVVGVPVPWDRAAGAAALTTYGAIIVSFLGGIRWGLAVSGPNPDHGAPYVVSVLPSLAAWAMLALHEPWRLASLGLLLLALGPFDRRLVSAGLAPAWFGRLRILLSCGAGAALIVAAAL